MGYRSQVYLKTTTEGYIVIKKFNDSIEVVAEKPLGGAIIQRTSTGFYKITFDDVKWYEGIFKEVDNFMKALDLLKEQDIPYSFIRIGEDIDDIVYDCNWTSDIPDAISSFEPVIDVNDDDWSDYEDVDDTDRSHAKEVMFDLFDECEDHDEIKDRLRDMNSDEEVSDEEYDYLLSHWDSILKEWTTKRKED